MHVTHDLAIRIEIAQHGRVARLNRLMNSNRAAGEIVTPPSITLPWSILSTVSQACSLVRLLLEFILSNYPTHNHPIYRHMYIIFGSQAYVFISRSNILSRDMISRGIIIFKEFKSI